MAPFSPDAIPDVAEVREGLVDRLERHRVAVLAGLAVAVFGSLGLLAWSSLHRERIEKLHTELNVVVGDFEPGRPLFLQAGNDSIPNTEAAREQAGKLEGLLDRARGTEVEPSVLFHLAIRYQVAGEDEKVLATIAELRERHPDSAVMQVRSFDSERASLVDRVETISRRRKEFAARHTFTDPKPEVSTVARVETALGEMKIVFYPDLAPRHVEAFVETARRGGFNGTQFYYLRRGEYIEGGGGEVTRNADPVDDREDDPALALAPEDAARHGVKHERGMVTSVPLLSGEQSDRFAVVIAETKPDFDSNRTPFGELLDEESREVADRIGSAMTYQQDATYIGDRKATDFPFTPSHPLRIRRVSIWKEGVLAEGHTWDTSRVGTGQPEPGAEEGAGEKETGGGSEPDKEGE